jgi:DNA-binding MarR family transcriptional regulator
VTRNVGEPPWSALLNLQRATHHTLHLLSDRLADLGLSAAEINVLGNLADGQERTVSELGRQVGSRPTTMTSILDRLTQKGLINRSTPAANRRIVVVTLTTAGRRVAGTVRAAITDTENALLAGLTPGDLASLRRALELLSKE